LLAKTFSHLIYQFVLAHSGWRHAQVIVGGESFVSLAGAMQIALWRLGGVPAEHRTDKLHRLKLLKRRFGVHVQMAAPGHNLWTLLLEFVLEVVQGSFFWMPV